MKKNGTREEGGGKQKEKEKISNFHISVIGYKCDRW